MILHALKLVDKLIKEQNKFVDKQMKMYSTDGFYSLHGAFDSNVSNLQVELFFTLVTGEKSWDNFYDRFDSPGGSTGKQPIAWGPRFLPDMISDLIWDRKLNTTKKVKEIKKIYNECLRLEREFKKNE